MYSLLVEGNLPLVLHADNLTPYQVTMLVVLEKMIGMLP